MHRALFFPTTTALTMALAFASSAACASKGTMTPGELCSRLAVQVDEAIKTNPANQQIAAATALQKKAIRLCAQKKRAQGNRTFAKALKLLGIRPVGID